LYVLLWDFDKGVVPSTSWSLVASRLIFYTLAKNHVGSTNHAKLVFIAEYELFARMYRSIH
jgi:hypothetical protein